MLEEGKGAHIGDSNIDPNNRAEPEGDCQKPPRVFGPGSPRSQETSEAAQAQNLRPRAIPGQMFDVQTPQGALLYGSPTHCWI